MKLLTNCLAELMMLPPHFYKTIDIIGIGSAPYLLSLILIRYMNLTIPL
ncbi:MAG: hypothetical protein AABY64_00470 [Bdellovibrionota bacterium]